MTDIDFSLRGALNPEDITALVLLEHALNPTAFVDALGDGVLNALELDSFDQLEDLYGRVFEYVVAEVGTSIDDYFRRVKPAVLAHFANPTPAARPPLRNAVPALGGGE